MTFISHAQNFEDVILWRALRDVPNGFYIDVGAWDPDSDSVTRAFSERGWRGINVEPLAEKHARLQERRPRDVNLAIAAGADAGSLEFHDVEQTGLSTSDPVLAGRYAALGFQVTRRRVEQLTLAEICRAHAPADIHFLKVDCEGHERAVLAGADFARHRPWVVLVEATVPCSQDPAFAEWEPMLLEAGYGFTWFDGLNRFYVAAEHSERLSPLIAVPPNCFDNFIRALDVAGAGLAAVRPHAGSANPVPAALSTEQRIQLATRCRDCDDLPKVEDAGTVLTQADGTRVQVMHNGVRVPADGYCGSWMTDLITRCRGHHEPQEERQFHTVVQALQADATMIELGGNWSYYTAWFLRGAAERRAVVLEPDPLNRAVGEQTMALNGLVAAGPNPGGLVPGVGNGGNPRAVFVEGFAGAVSAPVAPFLTERSGVLLLPCFSVPHLMMLHGMDRLDVLHCDTQGAELDVLQGCRALFQAGRVGWVLVSTHVPQISGDALTHHSCLELLRRDGAVIVADHDPWESFSGDGLIVARFGAFPVGWQPAPMTLARRTEALFRNPCHDLADAWAANAAMTARMEAFQEDVVRGSFQKLLLRPISPSDLVELAAHLHRGMDFGTWLDIVLNSLEFRLHRERFGKAYWAEVGPDKAGGTLPGLPAGSPVSCSAVEVRLERTTALGEAGERVLIPNDREILPAVLAAGVWLPEQLDVLAERLDPGRGYVLLDVGANVGLFSRQALRRFRNITAAHCVEPDDANHRALCANVAGLPGVDVTTHKIALGPEGRTVTFFRDAENCGNYSVHADAMRDRSFGQVQVPVVAAGPWLAETLSSAASIVWKSDTQGNDEAIVASVPWDVWRRVEVAVIELWRIRKPAVLVPEFLARVADMPHRRLGTRTVSVDEVASYLDADDWTFDDLYLWR